LILFSSFKTQGDIKMKKNSLLNESTIRRFMKLASVDALSDKFVQDKLQESETEKTDEEATETATEGSDSVDQVDEAVASEEDVNEKVHADKEEEVNEEEEIEEEVEADLEEMGGAYYDRDEEDEDLDADLGADDEADGAMVSVDQLMTALEKALEDVLGQEVEVSHGDDDEPEGMEMDAELDLGPAAPEGPEGEEGDEDEEPALEEDEYDVVEEIYSRIVQRLAKETKSK
jgi:hypothetical protein